MEQLMTVATYDKREHADALRHRLDGVGIPAEVFDERVTQRIWWLSKPRAAMRVRVTKQNADRALGLLREWAADPYDHILDDAIRCPECGSTRTQYPQMTQKTMQSFFFTLLTVLHAFPKQYYCQGCHFTWAAEPPERAPDLDILNWSMPRDKAKEKEKDADRKTAP